jgi:hypothetical protein
MLSLLSPVEALRFQIPLSRVLQVDTKYVPANYLSNGLRVADAKGEVSKFDLAFACRSSPGAITRSFRRSFRGSFLVLEGEDSVQFHPELMGLRKAIGENIVRLDESAEQVALFCGIAYGMMVFLDGDPFSQQPAKRFTWADPAGHAGYSETAPVWGPLASTFINLGIYIEGRYHVA